MEEGEGALAGDDEKRSPNDFALWKPLRLYFNLFYFYTNTIKYSLCSACVEHLLAVCEGNPSPGSPLGPANGGLADPAGTLNAL